MRGASIRGALALGTLIATIASVACSASDDATRDGDASASLLDAGAEVVAPAAPSADANADADSDARTAPSKATSDPALIRAFLMASRTIWCEIALPTCYRTTDATACIADEANGFPFFRAYAAAVDDGHVLFDRVQGSACLGHLRALQAAPGGTWFLSSDGTPAGFVEFGVHRRAYNECAAALHGTLAPGASCTSSVECVDGFCDVVAGATAGTCRGALSAGAACKDSLHNSEQCERLGRLGSDRACLPPEGAGADAATACELTLPNGATCRSDHDCLSGLCSSAGTCVVLESAAPYFCGGSRYTIRDAGGGG